MYPQIALTQLKPDQLDTALALGWYRIQQTLFTTDVLNFDGILYDAIWLRVRLADFSMDKKYQTLTRKNRNFQVEIAKLHLTPQHEVLYAAYKQYIPFDGAVSMQALLQGQEETNVFDSYLINIYDNDRLVGAGAFDLGENSAAGIFSVYDPAYKSFSLGKYMIYEKMQYCKTKGFAYFYPGYFVPGYPRFDYKTDMGREALEYYDQTIQANPDHYAANLNAAAKETFPAGPLSSPSN